MTNIFPINYARFTSAPTVTVDPSTGINTMVVAYSVGRWFISGGIENFSDIPGGNIAASVSVTYSPPQGYQNGLDLILDAIVNTEQLGNGGDRILNETSATARRTCGIFSQALLS